MLPLSNLARRCTRLGRDMCRVDRTRTWAPYKGNLPSRPRTGVRRRYLPCRKGIGIGPARRYRHASHSKGIRVVAVARSIHQPPRPRQTHRLRFHDQHSRRRTATGRHAFVPKQSQIETREPSHEAAPYATAMCGGPAHGQPSMPHASRTQCRRGRRGTTRHALRYA